jgi:hypothetical protein
MLRIRAFQSLAVASAVFYAAYLALPHLGIDHSAQVSQLLSMSGYGALPFTQHPAFYLSFGVAKLLATIGLVLFLPWGRWLLVAIAVAGLASLPFTGVAIGAPLDGIIGSLLTLSDGALLALSFSSPIAECWSAKARANQSLQPTAAAQLGR